MSDLDTLRRQGIKTYCVVDANGIAFNGTATLAQILAKGMAPICQVNSVGTETTNSITATALKSRGIKSFCQVDETGVDTVSGDTAAVIQARGILPLVALDTSGVAQNGTKTLAQLTAMALASFCPVDETGTEFALGGIVLSATTVPDGSANNTTVGTASIVSAFTGTAVWAIADADSTFKINSSTGVVQVLDNTDLVAATHPTITVTISVTGTTPSFPNLVQAITVTKAPANTVAPAIAGAAVEGVTLVLTRGTWTGNPTPTISDQWKSGGSAVTGEVGLTYVVRHADVGSTIKVTESATNSTSTVTQDSNTTATVTKTTLSYSPNTTATRGSPYTGATPSSSGGTSSYTYSITGGSLPDGLSLTPSTGGITGTPTTAFAYSGIVLRSRDANGVTDDSSPFTITVSAPSIGHTPPNLKLRDGTSYFLERNGVDGITLRVGVFVLLLHDGVDHLLLAHS
jgi:hypothetical protein